MSGVELYRPGPEDWAELRALRLAALADSPRLFGSTLERERGFDEAQWRRRAGGGRTTLARAAGIALGLVGWAWTDEPRRAELVSMWVAPAGRRLGVGRALVRAVVDDVVAARGAVLELTVVVDNAPAVGLYRAEGFEGVGHEIGTRSGDVLLRMRYTR